jgi:hypothetical protein
MKNILTCIRSGMWLHRQNLLSILSLRTKELDIFFVRTYLSLRMLSRLRIFSVTLSSDICIQNSLRNSQKFYDGGASGEDDDNLTSLGTDIKIWSNSGFLCYISFHNLTSFSMY